LIGGAGKGSMIEAWTASEVVDQRKAILVPLSPNRRTMSLSVIQMTLSARCVVAVSARTDWMGEKRRIRTRDLRYSIFSLVRQALSGQWRLGRKWDDAAQDRP